MTAGGGNSSNNRLGGGNGNGFGNGRGNGSGNGDGNGDGSGGGSGNGNGSGSGSGSGSGVYTAATVFADAPRHLPAIAAIWPLCRIPREYSFAGLALACDCHMRGFCPL